jgi:hypothetical protein
MTFELPVYEFRVFMLRSNHWDLDWVTVLGLVTTKNLTPNLGHFIIFKKIPFWCQITPLNVNIVVVVNIKVETSVVEFSVTLLCRDKSFLKLKMHQSMSTVNLYKYRNCKPQGRD